MGLDYRGKQCYSANRSRVQKAMGYSFAPGAYHRGIKTNSPEKSRISSSRKKPIRAASLSNGIGGSFFC